MPAIWQNGRGLLAIKNWRLPPESSRDEINKLCGVTGLGRLVCAVMCARGITNAEEIAAFLSNAEEMDSPYTIKDMDKAVERIREAMEDGERIAVYGDYDCDGITSTTILTSYFQSVGADVIYYVPSREKEGYGLNKSAVDILHQQKTDLIVTVDNGVSAHEEIDYAASLGIDVVVTDHHTPRETMPNAVAVVNPHRKDCPSKFKDLAGVGVAFKLICALEDAESSELLEYYSEIAALGTIADVVPLLGENRIIVKHGLKGIGQTENPGIKALLAVSGLSDKVVTGESAAFGIIPRINAAGRMSVVDDVIELLLTDDTEYAEEIAEAVNAQNAERKKIEENILLEIEREIERNPDILKRRVFMAGGRGWHHGVIGIVASKMMERYGRPVILFSIEGDMARGSGRSIEGFPLIEAISKCSSRLTRYGGHMLAAGCTLRANDLAGFIDEIDAWTIENYPVMPAASLQVDYIMTSGELTIDNIQQLSQLEPFGAGNEVPNLLLSNLKIEGIYPTTDKKHVRIRLQFDNHLFYAIYFNVAEKNLPCKAGDMVDIVAGVSVNEWNGTLQLSVRIKDLRPVGIEQNKLIKSQARYMAYVRREFGENCKKEEVLPAREDIAAVYRYIKKAAVCPADFENLYYRVYSSGIDFCRMCIAVNVMEEMGLVKKDGEYISAAENPAKVNLDDSLILSMLKS